MRNKNFWGPFWMVVVMWLLLLLPCSAIGLSGAWIADSGAQMVSSISDYGVSRQTTNQTEIEQTEETERTRIQWAALIRMMEIQTSGAVDIARIENGDIRLFDLLRLAATCLGALVLAGAGLLGLRVWIRHREKTYW